MTVRLHQLEGFYYTGLAGGYAAAARAMPFPITEPAIYQQVRKLEQTLGVPLCRQAAARHTELTPEGRVLHEFVTPFFAGLPAVLRAVGDREVGQLVIAAEGSIALDLLVPAVAGVRERHPGAAVRLSDRPSSEIARMVRAGEADAGLAVLGTTRGTLDETPLLEVRVALAVPEGHPLARRRKRPTVTDLEDVPLCVYERGQPGRDLLETAFGAASTSLRIAAEASNAETLRALVGAGVAPAFVPVVEPPGRKPRQRSVRNGITYFDVTGMLPGDPVTYGLLTRPGAPRHPLMETLRKLLGAGR